MENEQINQNSSPKPESSTNILVTVIIVFVVLVLLAIFGFWGYSIYQAKQIATENAQESTTPTVTPAISSVASATVSASPNDYVIYDSNTREITRGELQSLSEWQLKVARNEIYARHGRQFEHQDLRCYFDKQPWYKVDPDFTESVLTSVENKNIATILEYEQEINSSYLNYDSGCSNL